MADQLKSARLSDASVGSTIDDGVGALEVALAYLLGVPINTLITNPLFVAAAGGLTKAILQDLAGDPAAAGELARNGAHLRFHDGTAVREFRRSFKKITSGATIVNTTSESDILPAEAIPAGTLSTNGALKLTLLCKAVLAAAPGTTLTVRLKYGATTVASISIAWTQGTTSYFTIEIYLVGDGATNAQTGFIKLAGDHNEVSGNNLMRMASGAAIEDSTAAKNLNVTGQWDTNDDSFTVLYGILEKI